ncbi:hypothetical protein Dda_3720 [Drechslerella dactyloides]|uniref:Uncharacterized protein n=1 Tax=Drechslerella dactyloides TaxID=74499 RepID=A0AAD6NK65_DREDA|nr:hypothetical protein Dda_3720 [Drechslerella dactyloides]
MSLARGLLLVGWLSCLAAALPVARPQGSEIDLSISEYSDADESLTPPSQNSLPSLRDEQPVIRRRPGVVNLNAQSRSQPFSNFYMNTAQAISNTPFGFYDTDLDSSPNTVINTPPTVGLRAIISDGEEIRQDARQGSRGYQVYASGMNTKPSQAFAPAFGNSNIKQSSIFGGGATGTTNTPQQQSWRTPVTAIDQGEEQQSETVSSVPPISNYEPVTTPEKDVWGRLAGQSPFRFGTSRDRITPPLAWLSNGAGGRRPPPETERELELLDLDEVLQGIMTEEDDVSERAKLSCEITEEGEYCDEQVSMPLARPVSGYGTFEVRHPGRVGLAGAPTAEDNIVQEVDALKAVITPQAAGGNGLGRTLGYGLGPGRLGAGPRMGTMAETYR